MCETNDSNGDTAKTNSGNNSLVTRFWPLAADSSSNGTEEEFDRVWDDAELIAQYNKTEAQVKAQVEAFRSGRPGLPRPPSANLPPAGNSNASATSFASIATTNRKKRRHNKSNKQQKVVADPSTCVAGGIPNGPLVGQQQFIPCPVGGGGEMAVRVPSVWAARDDTTALLAQAASAVVTGNSNPQCSNAASASSASSVSPSPVIAAAAPGNHPSVSPVYSWVLPNVEVSPVLLPTPPTLPPPTTTSIAAAAAAATTEECSGCNHHHYLLDTAGVPPGATDVLPTTSTASKPPQHQPFTTYVPSISLTNTNGEIDTQALVRAWYQAGYAMGQAHADQILGLRPADPPPQVLTTIMPAAAATTSNTATIHQQQQQVPSQSSPL